MNQQNNNSNSLTYRQKKIQKFLDRYFPITKYEISKNNIIIPVKKETK